MKSFAALLGDLLGDFPVSPSYFWRFGDPPTSATDPGPTTVGYAKIV
jgi:hypothetical protein